ncbi:MAG: hypothetical protein EBY55_08750 [Gammaproteobacteria bacterium]|nr:hypothetical protein [Gammaproteobacteria bacterium]
MAATKSCWLVIETIRKKVTGNAWREMFEFGRPWFTAFARPRVSMTSKIFGYMSVAFLKSCEALS